MQALVHRAEECGELTQAAIKTVRFGISSTDPDAHIPKTNREALIEEAGDVIALIRVLTKKGVINKAKLKARVTDKESKYGRKYK